MSNETKFLYTINPHKPIKNLNDELKLIRIPKSYYLTKEEVLKCLQCGVVYRRFSNENRLEKVNIYNIDRLHNEKYIPEGEVVVEKKEETVVPVEEVNKIEETVAPVEEVIVEEPKTEEVVEEVVVNDEVIIEEEVTESEEVTTESVEEEVVEENNTEEEVKDENSKPVINYNKKNKHH